MKRLVGAFLACGVFAGCNTDPDIAPRGGSSSGEEESAGAGSGVSGAGEKDGAMMGSSMKPPPSFMLKPPPEAPGGTMTGGGGPTAGGVGGEEKNCGLQNFKLERQPAELLLVLDRSGSMKSKVGGSANSKWLDVTQAVDETIKLTESTVSWGLKVFPAAVECQVDDAVQVPIGATNYTAISSAITMTTPEGKGTPTYVAVQKAAEYLKTLTSKSPKYLVVATDGQPNCMDGVSDKSNDPERPIMAVAEAAAAGFNTFVVGIATTNSSAHTTLNSMAEAGKQARQGDTKYYAVASRTELVDALKLITGEVSSCVFPLDKAPPSPMDVAVKIDDVRVERDATHANGWDYGAGNKTIQLYGAACDKVKAANNARVNIIFGCPGVVIP